MRNILIIRSNLDVSAIQSALSDTFHVIVTSSGECVSQYLEKSIPDLILMQFPSEGNGMYVIFEEMKKKKMWASVPLLFLTPDSAPDTETHCLSLGAADFIPEPFIAPVIIHRITRTLELNDLKTDLKHQLYIQTRQAEKITLNSIMAIANTVDAKDDTTVGHSIRVAKAAEAIAQKIGMDKASVQNLHYTALLHDIGKISIPDAILKKTAHLTAEEFSVIHSHTIVGGEILKDIHTIPHVHEGALYHHERYDGSGYPCGLSGEDIPLTARIIAIADAYDAMQNDRTSRKKLSRSAIIEEFTKGLGTQFDPELGQVFIDMLKNGFTAEDGCHPVPVPEAEDIADESSQLLGKVLSQFTTEIKDSARIDPLTGLYNRTYMESRIEQLLQEAHSGALLMLDLDNFKCVNDLYGHFTGDQVIKIFAQTIRDSLSDKDYAGRIGGDEFIVFIADETDRSSLSEIAGHIITLLDKRLNEFLPQNITSASAGISICPEDGTSFLDLYKNADRALYHIKENGKKNFHFFRGKNTSRSGGSQHADLTVLQNMLRSEVSGRHGAYAVRYADFGKLYNFIARYVDRNQPVVQMLLFTLGDKTGPSDHYDSDSMERAMVSMESAIVTSLRSADVTTKYGNLQYIVILMDSNLSNGRIVAKRILSAFHASCPYQNVKVSYDIKTIEPCTALSV